MAHSVFASSSATCLIRLSWFSVRSFSATFSGRTSGVPHYRTDRYRNAKPRKLRKTKRNLLSDSHNCHTTPNFPAQKAPLTTASFALSLLYRVSLYLVHVKHQRLNTSLFLSFRAKRDFPDTSWLWLLLMLLLLNNLRFFFLRILI